MIWTTVSEQWVYLRDLAAYHAVDEDILANMLADCFNCRDCLLTVKTAIATTVITKPVEDRASSFQGGDPTAVFEVSMPVILSVY